MALINVRNVAYDFSVRLSSCLCSHTDNSCPGCWLMCDKSSGFVQWQISKSVCVLLTQAHPRNDNHHTSYDLTCTYLGCDNHVSWSAILRSHLKNYINFPKVWRFGLYVLMVTDGGLHTWRVTIPSHAVHYQSAIFERIVIKFVKSASVTIANDIPANRNAILISVE